MKPTTIVRNTYHCSSVQAVTLTPHKWKGIRELNGALNIKFTVKHLRPSFVLLDNEVIPIYLTRSEAAARKNQPNLYQTNQDLKERENKHLFTGKQRLQLYLVTCHPLLGKKLEHPINMTVHILKCWTPFQLCCLATWNMPYLNLENQKLCIKIPDGFTGQKLRKFPYTNPNVWWWLQTRKRNRRLYL